MSRRHPAENGARQLQGAGGPAQRPRTGGRHHGLLEGSEFARDRTGLGVKKPVGGEGSASPGSSETSNAGSGGG